MDGSVKGVLSIEMSVGFFESYQKQIFQHLNWRIVQDDDIYMTLEVYMEFDKLTKARAEALALLFEFISKDYKNVASCM